MWNSFLWFESHAQNSIPAINVNHHTPTPPQKKKEEKPQTPALKAGANFCERLAAPTGGLFGQIFVLYYIYNP